MPLDSRNLTRIQDPAIRTAILTKIEEGVPPTTAFRLCGIPYRTMTDWRHALETGHWRAGSKYAAPVVSPEALAAIEAIIDEIELAQAKFEAHCVSAVYAATSAVNANTGIPEWRASMEMLKRAPSTRANWREDKTSQVTFTHVPSASREAVRDLPEAELLEQVPEEYRLLVAPEKPTAE